MLAKYQKFDTLPLNFNKSQLIDSYTVSIKCTRFDQSIQVLGVAINKI